MALPQLKTQLSRDVSFIMGLVWDYTHGSTDRGRRLHEVLGLYQCSTALMRENATFGKNSCLGLPATPLVLHWLLSDDFSIPPSKDIRLVTCMLLSSRAKQLYQWFDKLMYFSSEKPTSLSKTRPSIGLVMQFDLLTDIWQHLFKPGENVITVNIVGPWNFLIQLLQVLACLIIKP